MIVTFTPNPAVDISTSVDRLTPTQKLHCAQPRYDAGGGGINVSKAIRRLGGQSKALFTAGGPMGLSLEQLVADEGVDYQIIGIEGLTRESFVVTESSTGLQYRFGTPGPELSPVEGMACLEALDALPEPIDFLVGSGSLPPGLPVDFYAQIARWAKQKGVRFVLDTSGEPLKQAVAEGVFLLKPNVGELARLVGKDRLNANEVHDAARQLIGEGRCTVVVVSLGPRGALLVTAQGFEYVPAPPVKSVSTVGAGDSVVGGMVFALSAGQSYREMVRLGVACGTAATLNHGTELFHKADVDSLLRWINGATDAGTQTDFFAQPIES
ncbi:hexose kinase [Rudanella paleaurantiibacter]|uniref:Hexose kinase n=1 Tax=Rudanella paleaurantiibacter TaxID=2614655 RepID=A0A7J5TYI9_9BACT|nr:1-phosphofructokinase family hexose kinase [Rudanella paleaurantiibacter]KAB7730007.1 hexose kinase [Rudanella paleaurantiibacter]